MQRRAFCRQDRLDGVGRFFLKICGIALCMWGVAAGLPAPKTASALAAPPLPPGYTYLSPRPGAQMTPPETAIALRTDAPVDPAALTPDLLRVVGEKSGLHPGRLHLADDGRTLIFTPATPFADNERVTVSSTEAAGRLGWPHLEFGFFTSGSRGVGGVGGVDGTDGVGAAELSVSTAAASPYVTLPADFPAITVTVPAKDVGEGYIFLTNFHFYPNIPDSRPYLLILDNNAEPVYYERLTPGQVYLDFKRQPDGSLTYWGGSGGGAYFQMDATYAVTDTWQMGNGYTTDQHEFQILPNGHGLLMSYDRQPVDMSQIVAGGVPTATVVGLVIQELDPSKNVVFEWRSWDHFAITDTVVDLTGPVVDYVHGNALSIDRDGHLLLTSRHLDEITKINRQTGEIIWRWGGKRNQFTFADPSQVFSHMHDARRTPQGTITLFDNRNHLTPAFSRAAEYWLDEERRMAVLVWEFRNDPDIFSIAMGNVQRLPNLNTVIGWGTSHTHDYAPGDEPPAFMEIHPDGSKAMELTFGQGIVSYRAFRFPWAGHATWPPVAGVSQDEAGQAWLHFSWNGETDPVYYRLYAGDGAIPDRVFGIVPKSGFETRYNITSLAQRFCRYRVEAFVPDKPGGVSSNVVVAQIDRCLGGKVFLPLVVRE